MHAGDVFGPGQCLRDSRNAHRFCPPLEQFQQKCEAVLRPELRENKDIEHLRRLRFRRKCSSDRRRSPTKSGS
ncbi:hypothetical protein C0075_05355 [Rhizobium sp. KAs_5_22]|nr:hypothetical protein C0075_05355 [Rhizobium sp. KAs_5_22]